MNEVAQVVKNLDELLRMDMTEDCAIKLLTLNGYLNWCAGNQLKLGDFRPDIIERVLGYLPV